MEDPSRYSLEYVDEQSVISTKITELNIKVKELTKYPLG